MRLLAFIFFSLVLQRLTCRAEEVEVIEAVASSDDNINNNEHSSSNNDDQNDLALDLNNLEEVDASPQKMAYNSGGPPPPSPGRINQNHSLPPNRNKNNNNYPNHKPFGHQKAPLPPKQQLQQAMDKYGIAGGDEIWPAPHPEMPKIISLDVKCEKASMKVYLGFDKPFYGIVFSKGHYSNVHCVHLPAGLGRTSAHFEIGIHACGTSGNTENGLYGYGAESGSGTYFENIIVIQYDPQVQEVWDQARKLRCTWHDQYEKSVTFRPFPVDMLDVVRTDFAGDNVGCWMQIQVGKGPWASEVSGLVKIGQTMTMVLAIKDDDSKFDMLVRNCMAHDGKRAPIQLVDQKGCVTRPKLMSRFTKIKNFGASASVLSYAHFQAFKFPDSMEVHFQCTIQICRYQCPDQCSDSIPHLGHHSLLELQHNVPDTGYGIPPPPPHPIPVEAYLHPRNDRRNRRSVADPEKEVGVNRVIRVVSTGDLTFAIDTSLNTTTPPTMVFPVGEKQDYTMPSASSTTSGLICMTTSGFAATLIVLSGVLIVSCLTSAFLCMRLRPFGSKLKGFSNDRRSTGKGCFCT